MMNGNTFRSDSIYISPKTKRRLRWLRQLEKSEARIVTSDEIAERLINEKIEQDFPNIAILEKRMNALEDQLLFELLDKPVAS